MTTEHIRSHLAACLNQISQNTFNLTGQNGSVQIRVVDEADKSAVVTVSVYNPTNDVDLIISSKIEKSLLIEDALTDAPICKKCNVPAKRGQALQNTLAGSSEWADGSMDDATLTLSGNAELVQCWKCPSCGHAWK